MRVDLEYKPLYINCHRAVLIARALSKTVTRDETMSLSIVMSLGRSMIAVDFYGDAQNIYKYAYKMAKALAGGKNEWGTELQHRAAEVCLKEIAYIAETYPGITWDFDEHPLPDPPAHNDPDFKTCDKCGDRYPDKELDEFDRCYLCLGSTD